MAVAFIFNRLSKKSSQKIVIPKTNATFKNDTKSQISQQNDVKL